MGSDFRILGTLEVVQDGGTVDLGPPRQRALLARLLIDPGAVVSADRLIDDLWLGDAPETARHALHVYVSRLRKALGPDRIRLERQRSGYRLLIEPVELDAARFEELATEGRAGRARGDSAAAGERLREALAQWRGPALADFADEVFAREEIARLQELRLSVWEQRIWADLDLGRHADLVDELQDLVSHNPFREAFWEQLMLALYRCRRQADALRVFQAARTKLAEELGIEPGPALRRMEERILAHDPGLDPAAHERARSAPSRLPLQRTSFVGRERELEQGGELLSGSRLLTLTGPPGSGKTRLAVRLAGDHGAEFRDGAVFVPLAAVGNPRFVDNAISQVLNLRNVPGESALDAVKAFLRDRDLLLVLDNFEQVIEAAPTVGELLDAAPGIRIIVTSRARLKVSGEQEFAVPPLSVPPVNEVPQPEALAGYDAVALFVARARAADPDFALHANNGAAVAELTARVDGLPLAIELAAARVKLLTPHDLLARLEQRLDVLTGGPTDAVDRHRTMRDAIAWSHDLLEPEEQALFRRLGSFVGGFTVEAAAAVADLPEAEALAGIDSLLAKSLLYRPVDVGQARFSMLEMIREYAREQLAATGEQDEVAARHAHYFLGLAEEIEPQLSQDPGGPGTTRLGAEIENLREVLRFALTSEQPDLGLDLANSIWRYWQSSEQLTEGREWLDGLLAHEEASAESRGKGLTALAALAYWQADYDSAIAGYAEALDLYRTLGDRYHEADTLYSMSLTANWKEDLVAGERLADQARAMFEELGAREDVAKVLMAQGFVLWRRNDLAAAKEVWEESLAIARETGNQSLANSQLVGLAGLTFHQGDPDEALRIVLEAVEEAIVSHNVHVTVWMLGFAAAFAAPDAPEAAVRLAGAADALRRESGGGIQPESLDIEDARTAAARALTAEDIERAWAQGRAMTLEQAVDQARQLARLISDGQAAQAHVERPLSGQ